MMTPKPAPMAQAAMPLRKKDDYGWRRRSVRRQIMWNRSMNNMNGARNAAMKAMDCGENWETKKTFCKGLLFPFGKLFHEKHIPHPAKFLVSHFENPDHIIRPTII